MAGLSSGQISAAVSRAPACIRRTCIPRPGAAPRPGRPGRHRCQAHELPGRGARRRTRRIHVSPVGLAGRIAGAILVGAPGGRRSSPCGGDPARQILAPEQPVWNYGQGLGVAGSPRRRAGSGSPGSVDRRLAAQPLRPLPIGLEPPRAWRTDSPAAGGATACGACPDGLPGPSLGCLRSSPAGRDLPAARGAGPAPAPVRRTRCPSRGWGPVRCAGARRPCPAHRLVRARAVRQRQLVAPAPRRDAPCHQPRHARQPLPLLPHHSGLPDGRQLRLQARPLLDPEPSTQGR
mmetsp:Transcript_4952/g.21204  ORF Transcript_4952/g.21204 Transcript_4952/m.21204 type:complete len:291 (+) Transcript_4952:2004-2876(+)